MEWRILTTYVLPDLAIKLPNISALETTTSLASRFSTGAGLRVTGLIFLVFPLLAIMALLGTCYRYTRHQRRLRVQLIFHG
jgi:hypothetical protein